GPGPLLAHVRRGAAAERLGSERRLRPAAYPLSIRLSRFPGGTCPAVEIGTSIFLIAVGAVLRYGVTGSISGVRIHVIGLILIVIGVIGLIVSLLYAFLVDRPRRRSVADDYYYDDRRTRTYR